MKQQQVSKTGDLHDDGNILRCRRLEDDVLVLFDVRCGEALVGDDVDALQTLHVNNVNVARQLGRKKEKPNV